MIHPDSLQFIPKKGNGYVYHIVCNNKHYIGISTTPFSTRWKRHKLPSSGCLKLKTELRRMQKAGKWQSIKAEILEEATDKSLDKLQQKYIKKYGSYNSFSGLNLTPGGRQNTPQLMYQQHYLKNLKKREKKRKQKKIKFTWQQV